MKILKGLLMIITAPIILLPLLFSSFVAACSGNDDTVTPEITIPANILTDGMTFSSWKKVLSVHRL